MNFVPPASSPAPAGPPGAARTWPGAGLGTHQDPAPRADRRLGSSPAASGRGRQRGRAAEARGARKLCGRRVLPTPHSPFRCRGCGGAAMGGGLWAERTPLLAVPASWPGEERPRGDAAGGQPKGRSAARRQRGTSGWCQDFGPRVSQHRVQRHPPGDQQTEAGRLLAGCSPSPSPQPRCRVAGTRGRVCREAPSACSGVARERAPSSQPASEPVLP